MTATKAIIFDEVDRVRLGDVTLPECKPNQILAKTIYTFTSPGTELRVLGGHYGAAGHYPVVPGYAAISEVIYCGADVKNFRIGDLISCRNPDQPFADCEIMWGGQAAKHVYCTEGEDAPVLLPGGVKELLPYTIAEVAAISLRGMLSARPVEGETALVIGAGLIGLFSAMFFIHAGCRVVVCDLDASRLKEAEKLGCYAAVNLSEPNSEERLKAFGNCGYDIVAEASGSIPGAKLACRMLRHKERAYYRLSGDEMLQVNFNEKTWPRLVFQANYVNEAPVNPHDFIPGEGVLILTPQDRNIEDRQRVIELIRRGEIDPTPFLNTVCKPEQMPEYYRKLQNKEIFSLICDWR